MEREELPGNREKGIQHWCNWKTNPLDTSELHATWLGWVTKDVNTNEEAVYILWHGGLLMPTSKHVLSRIKRKEAKEPIEPTIT